MKKDHKVVYRREPGTPMPDRVKRELGVLAKKPDREIDLSDIPELTDKFWKHAVRGKFYRPVKQAVSLRLDSDVLAWLKKDGRGYQTRANGLLRERMLAEGKRRKA
jgi:uncharacterized protein (DUF4415 family)